VTYATYTRETTEPLKRIAHFRRFPQVIRLIAIPLNSDTILDYGCGDGHLFSYFVDHFGRSDLVGYDPSQYLLDEASDAVRNGAILTADIELLKRQHPHAFSLIYCMEVCEHLTDTALHQLLENIKSLAAPHARVVFGIPIETGLSGFLKALYRSAHHGRQSGSFINAAKSLLGMSIDRTESGEWINDHTGFSHRRLRGIISRNGFRILRTRCLPWPALGNLLNNEIYFITQIGK